MAVLPDLRDLADRQTDRRRGLPRRKVAVVAEASRDAVGQGVGLPLDLGLLDQERRARVRLGGNQGPGEALQQTRGDRLVGLSLALRCLVLLVLGQVEVGLVGEDVGPAEVVASRAVELLESGLVRREVDERVAVRSVRAAAMLGRLVGELLRRGLRPALVRDLRVQDDEASFVGVGDVGVRLRADVDAGEVAALAALVLEPSDDLGPDVLLVEALGLVLGRAGDVGLDVVPVLARARVEVRRAVAELGQRRSGSCRGRRRGSPFRGTPAARRCPCARSLGRWSGRRRRRPCVRGAWSAPAARRAASPCRSCPAQSSGRRRRRR